MFLFLKASCKKYMINSIVKKIEKEYECIRVLDIIRRYYNTIIIYKTNKSKNVLKISNFEKGSKCFLYKEFNYLQKLYYNEFPVPRPIQYGVFHNHEFIIIGYMEGVTSEKYFAKVDIEEKNNMIKEVVSVIDEIYLFGIKSDLKRNKTEVKSTYKSNLVNKIQKFKKECFYFEEIKWADYLLKNIDYCINDINDTFTIIHNDLGIRANNILMYQNKVSCILDWERADYGEPISDIIRMDHEYVYTIAKEYLVYNNNMKMDDYCVRFQEASELTQLYSQETINFYKVYANLLPPKYFFNW